MPNVHRLSDRLICGSSAGTLMRRDPGLDLINRDTLLSEPR